MRITLFLSFHLQLKTFPIALFVEFLPQDGLQPPAKAALPGMERNYHLLSKSVTMKYFSNVMLWIIVASVFTSCAALGKMIEPGVWLGLLDLAAAASITVFIFRGVPR